MSNTFDPTEYIRQALGAGSNLVGLEQQRQAVQPIPDPDTLHHQSTVHEVNTPTVDDNSGLPKWNKNDSLMNLGIPSPGMPVTLHNSVFRTAMQRFLAASGGKISLVSGSRDVSQQKQLWDNAVAKYGPTEARKWAAPPGSSNHEKGLAADLRFADNSVRQWAHANAGKYGLNFPLSNEAWHIEPLGIR